MKNLSHITSEEAKQLSGLLFDLDDTLLEEGQLSLGAYQALFDLKACGLRLIALTGRPAAWAEVIARMWPVEAAIAENGAVGFKREHSRILSLDTVASEARAERKQSLAALAAEAQRNFPELVPADDVAGRVSDYTFDIGEHECASERLDSGRSEPG